MLNNNEACKELNPINQNSQQRMEYEIRLKAIAD